MNKTTKMMNIYEKANAYCIDIQKELRVFQLSTLNSQLIRLLLRIVMSVPEP